MQWCFFQNILPFLSCSPALAWTTWTCFFLLVSWQKRRPQPERLGGNPGPFGVLGFFFKQSKGEVSPGISVCHFGVTSQLLCLQRSQILHLMRHCAEFICVCMSIDSWMKLSSANSFNHGGFFASSGSLGVYSELQILMALFPYCETFDPDPGQQEECLSGAGGAGLIKHRKVWDLLRLLHILQSSHV